MSHGDSPPESARVDGLPTRTRESESTGASLESRWRHIAREHAARLAVHDAATGRSWSFAELETLADADPIPHPAPLAFPTGRSVEFIRDVLRAWKAGIPICPLESGQRAPELPPPGPGISLLKLTSGTTGAPRGVILTGSQVAADADQIVSTMGLDPACPNLGVISLAHSYGFANLVLPLVLHGVPLILVESALPEAVKRASTPWSRLTLPAVPALWRTWLEADAIPRNIGLAISAGAPLPLELEREVLETRGLKIHNFLGASECGGIAYDRSATLRPGPEFVGTAMDRVELSCDADGHLVVQSPSVASGYWPASDPRLGDGRYTSADLVTIGADGSVWIRGRAGDLINVAGRKVGPERIEQALMAHAAVRDCLAFGVPDASGRGEAVGIVYSLRSEVPERELREFVAARLAPWELPRRWWRRDSLETDVRGKRSRSAWRERLLAT